MSQPVEQANNENTNDEAEFEPLKGFENDYEIQTTYPYNIRKKKTGRILKESINKEHGYVDVCLNRKTYSKHILVAKQFIKNDDPEHKTQIDHINRDKTDYHLSNLRYVSSSENCRNRGVSTANTTIKYEFVDDIPDDAIVSSNDVCDVHPY